MHQKISFIIPFYPSLYLLSPSPQANHTVIDGIFGGQLISTITCSQCLSVNQVFEGFLDLSLPIIEEKGVPPLLRGGVEEKLSENLLDVETQHKRPVSKHMEKKKKKAAKREAKKGEGTEQSNPKCKILYGAFYSQQF